MGRLLCWIVVPSVIIAVAVVLHPVLTMLTGMAAKRGCSAVYVQGRARNAMELAELQKWAPYYTVKHAKRLQKTRASVLWGLVYAEAYYCPGFGCILGVPNMNPCPQARWPGVADGSCVPVEVTQPGEYVLDRDDDEGSELWDEDVESVQRAWGGLPPKNMGKFPAIIELEKEQERKAAEAAAAIDAQKLAEEFTPVLDSLAVPKPAWTLPPFESRGPLAWGILPWKVEEITKRMWERGDLDGYSKPEWNEVRASIIVWNDVIIQERYHPAWPPNRRHMGWSMTKSVLNAILGRRIMEGAMSLNDRVRRPEWNDDARSKIRVEHLLRMQSGLAFDESYGAFGDPARMLFASHDAASYAAAKPLEHPVGTHWSYSSGSSNLLSWAVRHSFGRQPNATCAYLRYPRRQLFDRIGAPSFVMEPDEALTFTASSFSYATPVGWARFGLLFQRDGVWGDERLLPEGWVARTAQPVPGSGGRYGAHWWLSGGDPVMPDVPADAIVAHGYENQYIVAIPSHNLTFVRLGVTRGMRNQEWWRADANAWIRDIMAYLDSLPFSRARQASQP